MTVRMARSGDGGWAPLEDSPPAMLADLLTAVDDLDHVLELGISAPIVADRPAISGRPDAIALTANGGIIVLLVAGTSGEELGERIALTSGVLHADADLVVVSGNANRIGRNDTLGTYVSSMAGTGDPRVLDDSFERALANGEVIYLAVCEDGHQHVAAEVFELEREHGVEIHCIDAVQSSTRDVHVVELVQVPRSKLRASAQLARTHGERAQLVQAVHGAMGDAVGELLRTLLLHVDAFFGYVKHDVDGNRVRLSAWLDEDSRDRPDLTVDSDGVIGIRLDTFSDDVRDGLVQRLARIVDADDGFDDDSGEAQLSLAQHLADVSLVEQFVGALSDAQLRTASDDLLDERAA